MITDIKTIREPKEVTISGWDDEDVTFMMRRPSLLALVRSGKIPNPLIQAVDTLFKTGHAAAVARIEDLMEVLYIIAESALVSPSLDELDAENIYLTDAQLLEIFAYAQGGVKELTRFRGIAAAVESDLNGEGVGMPSEQSDQP